MSEAIPYKKIIEKVKGDIDYIAAEAYQKGYAQALYNWGIQEKCGGWIPVSERLPETNDTIFPKLGLSYSEPCLVTYASLPDGTPRCNTLAVYCNNGKWYWFENEDYETACKVPIIAWMPLPEPYKEGECS